MTTDKKIDHLNPDHYKKHPSGLECREITTYLNFNLGNAWKYQWRGGKKPNQPLIRDLGKTRWYLQADIDFRKTHEDQELEIFLPEGVMEKMDLAIKHENGIVAHEVMVRIRRAVLSFPDTEDLEKAVTLLDETIALLEG